MKTVMEGGVHDPRSIEPALMRELYRVGNRDGHYRAFISLMRNSPSWEHAAHDYPNIAVPVLLVWGEHDWALPGERRHDAELIPNVESITVADAGHFLPLDAPDELARLIRAFASDRET
jgi:pimeloyl-ACP methyl ester carboxylesterase